MVGTWFLAWSRPLTGLWRTGDPVAVHLHLSLYSSCHRRVIFDERDVDVLCRLLTHVPSLTPNRPLFHAGAADPEPPAFHVRSGLNRKIDIGPVTFPPFPPV